MLNLSSEFNNAETRPKVGFGFAGETNSRNPIVFGGVQPRDYGRAREYSPLAASAQDDTFASTHLVPQLPLISPPRGDVAHSILMHGGFPYLDSLLGSTITEHGGVLTKYKFRLTPSTATGQFDNSQKFACVLPLDGNANCHLIGMLNAGTSGTSSIESKLVNDDSGFDIARQVLDGSLLIAASIKCTFAMDSTKSSGTICAGTATLTDQRLINTVSSVDTAYGVFNQAASISEPIVNGSGGVRYTGSVRSTESIVVTSGMALSIPIDRDLHSLRTDTKPLARRALCITLEGLPAGEIANCHFEVSMIVAKHNQLEQAGTSLSDTPTICMADLSRIVIPPLVSTHKNEIF
uniref:Uncharacterized protein n=1 Tax=viral metagenome TaxID=1070528 RepID=A0A2V0RAP3_9ZZZZ